MKDDVSNLSIEEQLEHYKNKAEKYEKDLVNCHESIAELVGSRTSARPSVTAVASKISHATKDAVSSHSKKTGYKPNNLE